MCEIINAATRPDMVAWLHFDIEWYSIDQDSQAGVRMKISYCPADAAYADPYGRCHKSGQTMFFIYREQYNENTSIPNLVTP